MKTQAGKVLGLLCRNGELNTLDNPGSVDTLLGDSSDLGIVIGNYGDATLEHAAMYDLSRALWTTLPDINNETANFGDGINNSGVATGSACNGNTIVGPLSNCVGWTWDEGRYSLFTAPDADETTLGTFSNGLNNRGQVVGYFQDSSGAFHGFLKDDSSFTTIDVPGALGTFPYDIDDREEIVGEYEDAAGASHGFTGSHGRFSTVDVPGAVGTSIFGDNDRGDLAGQWLDSAGTYHGFAAFKH